MFVQYWMHEAYRLGKIVEQTVQYLINCPENSEWVMDHEKMRRLHAGSSRINRLSYRIVLKSARLIAEQTWLFVFTKPQGLVYRAGQHVRLSLPALSTDVSGGNARFLSFATAPHEQDISFAIRMRDTPFKTALAALTPNDPVLLEMLATPPKNAFGVLGHSKQTQVFIAGGIGIVPAYSMIKALLHQDIHTDIVLITVNRRPEDAAFAPECRQLATAHPNMRFIQTMTAAQEDWNGAKGRIGLPLLRQNVPNLRRSEIYVTGLEGMVAATLKILRKAGVPARQVKAEQFGVFSGDHTTRPQSPGKHVLIAVSILLLVGLHAAVFVGLSGKLGLQLTWSFQTTAIVMALSGLVAVKLFFMAKRAH